MSLLNEILKQIQGGVAQVNLLDGGEDYRSVTQRPVLHDEPIDYAGRAAYYADKGLPNPGRMKNAWDTNDSQALFSPDDPRSQREFRPSGIETNGTEFQRYQPVDPRLSVTNRLNGAINPLARLSRPIIYSPGEGPRTRF